MDFGGFRSHFKEKDEMKYCCCQSDPPALLRAVALTHAWELQRWTRKRPLELELLLLMSTKRRWSLTSSRPSASQCSSETAAPSDRR